MEPSPAPKVTLVGFTTSAVWAPGFDARGLGPLQLIAVIWKQSKELGSLKDIMEEVGQMDSGELADLMVSVLEGVPVVEAVTFNFIIENASISWREQMVRHRVGTHPDSRVGADWAFNVQEVPEQADMSAWSQSMRLLDLTDFATRRAYRTPDAVVAMGPEAIDKWHNDMVTVQGIYSEWAQAGLALEDAREFIPLGATSRLSWSLNLRTLQHIVGKRGCTILQLGLWGPIILGIVEELVTKLHPVFGRLVTPPCMKGSKYTGCIFPEDIRRRADGLDGYLPVCPLYLGKEPGGQADRIRALWEAGTLPNIPAVHAEAERRRRFWGRDPFTGEAINNSLEK